MQKLLLTLFVFLFGCSHFRGASLEKPLKIDRESSFATEVPVPVKKSELENALAKVNLMNGVRLIEIYNGVKEPPRYRIFGIQPGSAYDLLKIQNADVIVAADDYIIYDPGTFYKFITLLPGAGEAKIRLSRDGAGIDYVYRISQ